MPTLLLIRHGLNDFVGKRLVGRTPGVHLNEKGREQARALAAALAGAPIKAIYSSPLERAVETAEPLAAALGLTVQVRHGLAEIDFGGWVGKTGKQMARTKLWKIVQEAPSQARFPGGESFPEAQGRIAAALDAILAGHADEDWVACFSHSDAIKLAIAHYLGLPLDNFQRLYVDTASITVFHFGAGRPPLLVAANQAVAPHFHPGDHPQKQRAGRAKSPQKA